MPNPKRDLQQLPLSFKDRVFGEDDFDKTKMNRLIWGDNLLAMQALLSQGYEGKINLIYIDPPFDSKADYSHKITLEGEEVTKEPSVIERLAYKDTWTGGTDSYLDMLYPRLHLMRRLLAEDGLFMIHLDWHVSHYAKTICDEVFGKDNFRNELIVKRVYKNLQYQFETLKSYPQGHDVIFLYTKAQQTTFKPVFVLKSDNKHPEGYWKGFWNNADRPTMRYSLLGVKPNSGQWKWNEERATRAVKNYIEFEDKSRLKQISLFEYWQQNDGDLEFIRKSPNGVIEHWVAPSDTKFLDTLWLDIVAYSFTSKFNTEKSEALLGRIIDNLCVTGGTVADFFLGSGTTVVVAEKLGRRWIGCELGKVGVQVARSRLVKEDAKPFLVENIGNYQREMIYLHGGKIKEMQRIIMKLYGAKQRKDYFDLGVKVDDEGNPLLVYVGYPDRPVTAKKTDELLRIASKLDGSGYKKLVILAWDYEPNFKEALDQRKRGSKDWPKTTFETRMIPPDVYEYLKKAKNEEELEKLADKVQFFERPYLKLGDAKAKPIAGGKYEVEILIDRYTVFDFPVKDDNEKTKLREIVRNNFAALIDYWAVDWDYDGFTFKSEWQDMRGFGKKAKVVSTKALGELEKGRVYTVCVRIVDIFGNDASATVELNLR